MWPTAGWRNCGALTALGAVEANMGAAWSETVVTLA
jgi:hypothetical protein